jgi:hypothetical protein
MFVFLLSVSLHEIGHALYLKYKKIDYERGLDDVGYYFKANFITKENKFYTAIIGIFLGLLPLVVALYVLEWASILIILYLVGCISDIKVIMGVNNYERT